MSGASAQGSMDASRPDEAGWNSASAPRLVSAGLEAAIERFNDPRLLAEGKVNLISLEAVEKRFGARWRVRQDQVYDFAERVLERGVVDAHGFFLRVSHTDYLIIHPDLGRLAGQAACLRYLREILHYFLGEAHLADLGVLEVTKITKGGLEAQVVDVAAADRVQRAADRASESAGDAVAATGPRASVDTWSPFVAADGRLLRVSATLEPVYELKGFTRIGFRMIRRVTIVNSEEELSRGAVMNLSASDILQADLATVARGMDRLRSETGEEQQLSLVVPLSYTSLASQRGRAELVKLLKEASGLTRCGVICEICDIEGVPEGALLAAVSLIRPFAVLVVGRLAKPSPGHVKGLRGAGLNALSLECPPGLSEAEFSAWANSVITATRRVVRSVIVYSAPSPRHAAELALLGATHVSLNLR